MPSGKTHDVITLLLAPPTMAAAWGLTGSWALVARHHLRHAHKGRLLLLRGRAAGLGWRVFAGRVPGGRGAARLGRVRARVERDRGGGRALPRRGRNTPRP